MLQHTNEMPLFFTSYFDYLVNLALMVNYIHYNQSMGILKHQCLFHRL